MTDNPEPPSKDDPEKWDGWFRKAAGSAPDEEPAAAVRAEAGEPSEAEEPEPATRSGGRHEAGRRKNWRAQVDVWARRLVVLAEQLLRYRYATAALVLVAVAALYGVAAFSRPSDGGAAPAGARVPVTTAVVACPAPGDSRVAVLNTSSSGSGRADVSSTEDGSAVTSLTKAPWSQDVEDGPDAYSIRAQGSLATGLEVERTTVLTDGDDRGVAATRCVEPGTDMWFIGPGPLEAGQIDLYVTNVDSQQATIDLTALSGEGPLDTVDGRGTPVDPGTTKVIRLGGSPEGLGEIVSTAQIVALRVRATTGRIAAAVRVRIDEEKGVDWLPLAGAPTTSVTVPGIPDGSGERRLLVAVPGQDDARIRVQVLTGTGAFAPEGQDTMDAPAGTVTPLALERALSGKSAAVRLVSDQPIVAGFTAERGDDVAFGAATEPLTGNGGVIADNRYTSTVLLTAPYGTATVRVTTISASGTAASPQQVNITAGRTSEVKAGTTDDGVGLLITPLAGSGPVHAARVMSTGRSGRLFTVLPVTPAISTVLLPPVRDSQSVVQSSGVS